MFAHPLVADVQDLEPIVLLDDGVYGKTRAPSSAVTLETAAGIAHPLRCLASRRTWNEHAHRLVRDQFIGAVHEAVTTRRLDGLVPLLTYFLTRLAPRFHARDWAEPAAEERFDVPETASSGSSLDVEDAARSLPYPPLPAPALLVLGRLWPLADVSVR